MSVIVNIGLLLCFILVAPTFFGKDMWWQIHCFSGALAVTLGAFGAHGLKQRVVDVKLLAAWDTAVKGGDTGGVHGYQGWDAVVIPGRALDDVGGPG